MKEDIKYILDYLSVSYVITKEGDVKSPERWLYYWTVGELEWITTEPTYWGTLLLTIQTVNCPPAEVFG